LSAEDLSRLNGFARYKDVDGDGIGYRTLPGTNHPAGAWFARGSGHNEKAQYSEREDDYVNNVDRLARKFETMRAHVPRPEVIETPGAGIGIVCCGSSRYACEESRDQLMAEYHVCASYLRLKAYPFTDDLGAFVDAHERVYVVEQNRDAQLLMLMRMEFSPERISKFRSVRHYSGLPIDARSVTENIVKQEGL